MTAVLIRKRKGRFETDPQGKIPCEDRGRDWSDASNESLGTDPLLCLQISLSTEGHKSLDLGSTLV